MSSRLFFCLFLLICSLQARARYTYYVDALTGNDTRDGLSAEKALKSLKKVNDLPLGPGDSVLFRNGQAWHGGLIISRSGSSGAPIVFAGYGNGKRPILDGEGLIEAVIFIDGADQVEIKHLEITNPAAAQGNRTGILIKALQGLKRHYVLNDLYIHDVFGNYSFETKGKNTGGIGIIGGPETKFDDILIENCEIGQVTRVGIFTNLTDGKNAIQGNRPITNLIIRRNKIHHCAGDGVIVRYAYRPLIEYNVAYENHNGPENLVKHGVALWCRSTDEAVFQYNEVYQTRGSMDGQAFDTDLDTYRTLVQYNYSHDNEGGFMLVYGSSKEAIVRYNVSAGDGVKGKHIFDFPVWVKPRGSGIFHNNTIIIPKEINVVIADEALQTAKFYNNIFYNLGSGNLTVPSENQTAFFMNNEYYGYPISAITDSLALMTGTLWRDNLPFGTGMDSIRKLINSNYKKLAKKGITVAQMMPGYWLPDAGEHNIEQKQLPKPYLSIGAH